MGNPKDNFEQPTLQIPLPSPDWVPVAPRTPQEPKRGVIEIDLMGGDDDEELNEAGGNVQ